MKKQILLALIEKLKAELAITLESATAAHQVATGPDSKAENKYDTRGLEASYLAEGQMKRAAEYERQLAAYQQMLDALAATATPSPAIAIGSLVELKQGTRRSHYYIVTGVGGLALELDGRTINVITPQSPLGDALLGAHAGDTVEVEMQGGLREYGVVRVE